MCGRFNLYAAKEDLEDFFSMPITMSVEPRFNIAPSQNIMALHQLPEQSAHLTRFQWGLIPSWAFPEDLKRAS